MISAFASFAAAAIFGFTMVYAGLMDLTTMRIRNGLVVFFLAAYLVLAPLAGITVGAMAWNAAMAAGVRTPPASTAGGDLYAAIAS